MRVPDLWTPKGRATLSFELFPARNQDAAQKMDKVIDELAELEPDFVSVTFGAGGSTKEGSRELVRKLKKDKGLEVMAYFAGYGLGPGEISSVLDEYQKLGVENILVVRGDAPEGDAEFTPHPDSFKHASDLLPFIKARYNFCLGAAAYPEGHIDAGSLEKDLPYIKLKVEQGAQYLIANYCYDNKFYFDFVQKLKGLGLDIPVLPGVMPIYSVKLMENLAALCGAKITDEIRKGLAGLPEGDKKAVTEFGIDFAARQCRDLIENGAPGVHVYTMDRSKTTVEIVSRLRADGLL